MSAALIWSACACSDVDCAGGVSIDVTSLDLADDSRVDYGVCVENTCREARGVVSKGRLYTGLDITHDDEVELIVHLARATGEVLADARGRATVMKNRPNGEHCSPVCRNVVVAVRGATLIDGS